LNSFSPTPSRIHLQPQELPYVQSRDLEGAGPTSFLIEYHNRDPLAHAHARGSERCSRSHNLKRTR
jgi:hypothetical protein